MYLSIEVEAEVGTKYPTQTVTVIIGEGEIFDLARKQAESTYKDKVWLHRITGIRFEP